MLPSISAQEDSFAARVEVATEAKAGLAAEAVTMLSPGETVLLPQSPESLPAATSSTSIAAATNGRFRC